MSGKHIIVFIGYVGAGKTTQAKYLEAYLKKRGQRSKFTYLKTYFILTNNLLRIFRGMNISRIGLYFIHRLLVVLDLVINVFILTLLALFRVRIPSKFYKYILIEEYLPGTLVDYVHAKLILRLNRKFLMRAIHVLLRLLYIDSTTIVLVCNVQSLPYRWKARNTPSEAHSYLKVQEKVFSLWSKHVENTFYISTEGKSVKETNREIRKLLNIP